MCNESSLTENLSSRKTSSDLGLTEVTGILRSSPDPVWMMTLPLTLIPQMTPEVVSSQVTRPPSRGLGSKPPMRERELMMAACCAVKFSPSPSCSDSLHNSLLTAL